MDTSKKYYLKKGEELTGPFSVDELAAQGLLPSDRLFATGWTEFRDAKDIPELAESLNISFKKEKKTTLENREVSYESILHTLKQEKETLTQKILILEQQVAALTKDNIQKKNFQADLPSYQPQKIHNNSKTSNNYNNTKKPSIESKRCAKKKILSESFVNTMCYCTLIILKITCFALIIMTGASIVYFTYDYFTNGNQSSEETTISSFLLTLLDGIAEMWGICLKWFIDHIILILSLIIGFIILIWIIEFLYKTKHGSSFIGEWLDDDDFCLYN